MLVRRGGPRSAAPAALACLAAAILTGCGNSESPSEKGAHAGSGTATTVDGVRTVTITTGNDLRFHPSTIVVHPGRVRVLLENTAKSGPPHTFQVTGFPGDFVPTTSAGSTRMTTFTAPSPGKYGFVCTIHVAQGQTGTLIVRPGDQ